ncbi:MAG: hypothetical protein CMP98_08690 [Gammaproteobacteria bacterium]|nr:hypothetical protein [Gammaproteobacteria bacterium]OUU09079.1 MAG: hypothetical protein CBB94_08915 [Gammaproteobacteria bacterium TMED34]
MIHPGVRCEMLFNVETATCIRNTEITLSLRKWRRPQARDGGVYFLRPSGTIELTAMTECKLHDVSTDDLRDTGFVARSAAVSVLGNDASDPVWVVRFSHHPNCTRPLPDRTSVDSDEVGLER